MAGTILSANQFWVGTELDAFFAKRGAKLRAIKEVLESHKGSLNVWQTDELKKLAEAIAIYASAKDWKGIGPIGTRDGSGTITKLVKEVDEHLAEHGMSSIRRRLSLPDLAPVRTPAPAPPGLIPPRPGASSPAPRTLPGSPPPRVAPVTNRPPMPPPRNPPVATPPMTTGNRPAPPLPRSAPVTSSPVPPTSNRPVSPPPPISRPPAPQTTSAPVPKKKAETSDDAIKKCRSELDLAKQFGCRDVVSFFQCVKGYERDPNLPREQRDKAPPQGDPNRAAWFARHKAPFKEVWERGAKAVGGNMALSAPISNPFEWNAKKIEMDYKKVKSDAAAECTSFGWYAAHLLTTTDTRYSPRVEIVSWVGSGATHVYCIVNRDGDYEEVTEGTKKKYKLPPVAKWTGKVWIVDPWAASLGHECVYEGVGSYPLRGMTEPLYLNMVYDD